MTRTRQLTAGEALPLSVAAAVVAFASVMAARAQEDSTSYWRADMGPLVLSDEQEKEKAAKRGSDFTECANGCPTSSWCRPAGS